MASNTYVALDKATANGSTSTITFSSIPATYTDLVLVIAGNTVNQGTIVQFNSDTATNYSRIILRGNGTAASSVTQGNQSSVVLDGSFSQPIQNAIVNIFNYANTTTYKTSLVRSNNAGTGIDAIAATWRSTSAINRIDITLTTANFSSGTTFSLYGIRAEGVSPAPKATGGAIYSDSTYYYHVFGSTGTFTPLAGLTADVLLVAGGGAGNDGGGGAGGVAYYAAQSLSATGYTCTVGAGGSGAANGANTGFTGLTSAIGGGKGGIYNAVAAGNGGSGGGAARVGGSFGTATSGQGFQGGSASVGSGNAAGGGGGAGAIGGDNSGATGGAGGIGTASYNSWSVATGVGQLSSGTYYIAGGGGGFGGTTAGVAGLGGGGTGSQNSGNAGTDGTANTGGGGGGRAGSVGWGNGGSGIVIVRYLKA